MQAARGERAAGRNQRQLQQRQRRARAPAPRRKCPDLFYARALQEDVREAPVELYHRLKLYDDTGAANPKKPVGASWRSAWRPAWRQGMSMGPRPAALPAGRCLPRGPARSAGSPAAAHRAPPAPLWPRLPPQPPAAGGAGGVR